MQGDAIPRELRELAQWVLYRVQKRKGKSTKVPYQVAHAGRLASATDLSTWGTFEAAVEAHERRGRGDGIGFVFAEGDPFVGIDLDKCMRTGAVALEAQPILERLPSYTELSPSGTGLHVIGRGQIGGGRRTSRTPWGGEFEVYDRARFFTMTGRRLPGTPADVLDLPELVAVRGELVPELNGGAPAAQLVPPAERLDDREVLEKAFAARNAPKFRALWEGDTSAYKSASEAEIALVQLLAFWTGPDEQQIDRLFRQSGLVRPKWEERADYREATIGKALAGRTEYYGVPPARLRAIATAENALEVASAAIRMESTPIVAARERLDGPIVLERADGLALGVPSLGVLARYATLAGELAAQFGHELVIEQKEKTATAHRFVAALRRHFGVAHVEALEQRVEGWLADLVRVAAEVPFTTGDGEGKVAAWRQLDEADPEASTGARAFAGKVLLAHDLSTGDRYLRAGWAQEYVRRCGYRGSPAQVAGVLERVGLEQPNPQSGGQVRAKWRAGGDTLTHRFWIIPADRAEAWRAEP